MFPGEMVETTYARTYKEREIIGQLVIAGNIDEYIQATYYGEPGVYDDFITFFNQIRYEIGDMCDC